ncbi:MAG: murein hydrolase activator EnvC family protein [Panacagrimonas sp.]
MTPSRMPIIASTIAPRLHRLTASCVILILVVASLVPVAARADAADEAKREAELKSLRARISRLDRELGSDRRNQDTLRRQIEDAEKLIAAAARSARQTEAAEAAQREQVKAAQAARAQTLGLVEQHRDDLAKSLRASYMAGNPGRLQLAFRQNETAGLGRLDADIAALARALHRQLAGLETTLMQLALAEQALATEQEALEQRSRTAREALVALQHAQRGRREKLDALARRGSSRAMELAQAQAEHGRVEKLLEDLRQALLESPTTFERGTPFNRLRGRLPWPLRGSLLARFGSPKGDGPLTWSGMWIKAAAGAAVKAVADGRVVYVGWLQRYGLVVIVDHPGKYLSIYGHLQEAQVEVGETVDAGRRVASAGNSGGHEQTGVYFEIRQGAAAIDPRAWLAP